MAIRPPPHFVVRTHASTGRHRLWWGLAWLASLLLTGLIVGLLAFRTAPSSVDRRQQQTLNAQIEDLKQQVANLERAAQVNEVATRSLRGTLTQRETELSSLRADLGFYSRLVGGDNQRQGMQVQGVRLQPIAGSRGWNLTLSLTQNAKRSDDVSGTATVSVEGLRDDKVVQLDWPALGDAAQKAGMPFRFMYFQQLHGTLVLPAGFRPTRLHIRIQPTGGPAITRTVGWDEALGGNLTTVMGDHDAQP